MTVLNKLATITLRCGTFITKAIPNVSIILSNILYNRSGQNYSCEKMTEKNSRFEGIPDKFEGVTINSAEENCEDSVEFQRKLQDSLAFWEQNGKKTVWFNVLIKQADCIPILAKNGFKYHHAKEDYIMMYKWLPKLGNIDILPYAHTVVGVGAVIINDKSQILVICEKNPMLNKKYWKLPGGYVEPGENLVDAAIREVHEETNISTRFNSVITFAHAHHGTFDCSDIYVVISLTPLSEEIKKCEREIADCIWMDVGDYMEHPMVHDWYRFFVQKYLEYRENNIKINCFNGIQQHINKPYTMYSVTRVDHQNKDIDKCLSSRL